MSTQRTCDACGGVPDEGLVMVSRPNVWVESIDICSSCYDAKLSKVLTAFFTPTSLKPKPKADDSPE